MTYYGLKNYSDFFVARTLLPANQIISYSDGISNGIADLVYRTEDSSSVTFVEGTSNTALVGTIATSGELIFPKALLGQQGGTFVIQTGNNNVESISIKTFRNLSIANAQVVNVSGLCTIPSDTFALVVEGTIEFTQESNTNVSLIANQDLYVIGRRVNGFELSGSGRIVTFNLIV